MSKPSIEYDFRRYLRSKRSVEARALNHDVWRQLADQIKEADGPVRVIELGAGIGSIAMRFLEKSLFREASYTLVEHEAAYLVEARIALKAAAQKMGYQISESSTDQLDLIGKEAKISFLFAASDAGRFLEEQAQSAKADLLVAHAFLDLLNLEKALDKFLAALRPGGLFYFPITYDGLTSFEPQVDIAFEVEMLALYHRTMDERVVDGLPSGDSQTGRHLFAALGAADGEVIAAGSSDWVVFPQRGSYIEDEAYFLLYILHTIEGALSDHPELDAAQFGKWLSVRREQVEQAKLSFIAHQLDILGRKPA
jgi:hypothetical protein